MYVLILVFLPPGLAFSRSRVKKGGIPFPEIQSKMEWFLTKNVTTSKLKKKFKIEMFLNENKTGEKGRGSPEKIPYRIPFQKYSISRGKTGRDFPKKYYPISQYSISRWEREGIFRKIRIPFPEFPFSWQNRSTMIRPLDLRKRGVNWSALNFLCHIWTTED